MVCHCAGPYITILLVISKISSIRVLTIPKPSTLPTILTTLTAIMTTTIATAL